MRREVLSVEAALDRAASRSGETPVFPWALIQTYSRAFLGNNPLVSPAGCPGELLSLLRDRERFTASVLEARFFSDGPDEKGNHPRGAEIRLFRGADGLQVVQTAEEEGDLGWEETSQVAHQGKFGGSVTVRRSVEFDEDGQAWIASSRLSGWKEAEEHG